MAKHETLKQMEKRHAQEHAALAARCKHRMAKWITDKSSGNGNARSLYCEKCNSILAHREDLSDKAFAKIQREFGRLNIVTDEGLRRRTTI